jgi:hypothetical protein
MNPDNPFPTVTQLAQECGVKWPGFVQAAEGTHAAEDRFRKALLAGADGGQLLGPDCSLILSGSFARYEMTEGSDYDWSLLVDGVVDNSHGEAGHRIGRALKSANLKAPGSSGTFGNLVFSHDLVHRIGGKADSNENLTRRIVMLLESRPFAFVPGVSQSDVWDNVVKNILERYFEQDVHFTPAGTKRVPRFLLNDLTRYWRTIGVDYAAKHREQDGEKWASRNAKLRLSRKLIYASGLAFCLSCELNPPSPETDLFGPRLDNGRQPFIQSAIQFARTPSLEYLAKFVVCFVPDPGKRKLVAELLFGSYNEWLLLMAEKANRECLVNLSQEDAKNNATFAEIRRIGITFARGLKLLFFNREMDNDPIANLSLDYVGF